MYFQMNFLENHDMLHVFEIVLFLVLFVLSFLSLDGLYFSVIRVIPIGFWKAVIRAPGRPLPRRF